jgi:glutamate-ammonia-ligase adenylyltransferase
MHPGPTNPFADAAAAMPAVLRDIALNWYARLQENNQTQDLAPASAETLAKLVASSEFAATTLLREWEWFLAMQPVIDDAPDADALDTLVQQIRQSDADIEVVKGQLRRIRQRYMLQILWREVSAAATLNETLFALSNLADRLLDAAAGYAGRMVEERYGVVRDRSGTAVSLLILGMGKLGGKELNFSSDIDLIFLYPTGTESDGAKNLSAPEYFARVSRHIVALLDEVTADGFAFRIDTRLRPFGDSGAPVASFAALEAYLLQHGRDWERYAYVKARIVGPQPSAVVAEELQENMITPFVYRRYIDFGVFESLRDMHRMIAAEVSRREMADNIKLGPGGIREIEFIVQSLQLVRGGANKELQQRSLLPVLPALVGRHGLAADDARVLDEAYCFLRRLENFIQAIRDMQTHDLPTDPVDQLRLSMMMGYPDWPGLLAELNRHRNNVTMQFDAIAFRGRGDVASDPLRLRLFNTWESVADTAEWRQVLDEERFLQADELAAALVTFSGLPAIRQLGATSLQRLKTFVPELLLLIKDSARPLVALNRVLAIVEKILRRSAYIALLNENTQVLARLIELCERSMYIAEQIARYPVLLDELLDPGSYSMPVSREQLTTELAERIDQGLAEDSEAQMAILGQFQRASMFRIAVADITGSLPIMKVSDSLTELAEAVLDYALKVAWEDMIARHGAPGYVIDGKRRLAGFGIIAYGKLGGLELSYGSDLDLVFLHDSRGSQQETDGDKPLQNSQFFTRLVRRLSHFLTTQTGSGMLYEVDTRLRPDGQSGVMVSSVDAFERYQEANAWTWEHQALLRARAVAGSASIAQEFDRIRADTLSKRVRLEKLRNDVVSMRTRMRESLDKSSSDYFDLKQGVGGIADIEFLVQYLVLANAAAHRSVFHYSDNIRQLDALRAANCVSADESATLQDIYRSYRLRLHHLALDQRKPLIPVDEFVRERGYVSRMWRRTFADDGA